MKCHFENKDGKCVCKRCGFTITKSSKHECERHRAECGQENGLGDWVEQWLTSWGLTKDKYVELKAEFGLPPTCNCDGRQQWLNRAGAYLGIAANKYGPNRKKNNGP